MELFISKEKIKSRLLDLAADISNHYQNKNHVMIVGVLKGSFMFFADLVREIDVANTEIEFISISSYEGIKSGKIKGEQIDYEIFHDKNILIVEDIIDTGKTMNYFLDEIYKGSPNSVEIVSFLFKPEYYKLDHRVKWFGFEMGAEFVVGYGLDYKENFRNLKDLYIIDEEK